MGRKTRDRPDPAVSEYTGGKTTHMIKKAAAVLAGIFLAVSLMGCSGAPKLNLPFLGGDPEPDYKSGVVEEEFQGITYQVPEAWQSQESEDGETRYYYPVSENGELPVSIMLQYAAMDEELWEDGELEFLHTLSADYKSLEGISNFKQEDSSLGEIPVVKITCDQTPGEGSGTYHARYTLIPVNREAVLTVASAVPEDADNNYEEDFEFICESIEIPE